MGNSNGKPVVLTDEVNLNHFRLLRVVGKGAFGKVRIVERKDSGLTFALKYIRKDEVVRSESVRNIIRERRMLEHLNHPFLCNLRYSFQDIEYLYIVVDLMNGGDLRFHITRKTFTEEAVRFWIAEMGCALRYIHRQGIVHRDVKPDNVLLDSQGHIHLTDFNVASDFTPGRQLTSKSGTLAYLAPDVYAGKGYSSEVDWWSLGVLFYECIYNKRPFEAHNHEALAQSILKAEPPFPLTSPAVSMPCLHAISSLLERNKKLRIGAAGFHTFTDNPFFRPIDFDALERKEIEPVFCPSSDKTNFDATYDLEELLLEEAPLEARARKQKPRAELREDATQQEIRADELHKMIETMFEPFNYTTLPEKRSAVATTTPPASSAAMEPSSKRKYGQTDRATPPPDEPVHPSQQHPPPAPLPEQARPIPLPKSQTPGSVTGTHSSTNSPDGSPPLPNAVLSSTWTAAGATSSAARHEHLGGGPTSDPSSTQAALQRVRTERVEDAPSPTSGTTHALRGHRSRASPRSASVSGGIQVPSPEQSSWGASSILRPGSTTPTEEHKRFDKPAGMLGFLSRKKGRDRSPRGKERERGVIGKEGARVVVVHHHG